MSRGNDGVCRLEEVAAVELEEVVALLAEVVGGVALCSISSFKIMGGVGLIDVSKSTVCANSVKKIHFHQKMAV